MLKQTSFVVYVQKALKYNFLLIISELFDRLRSDAFKVLQTPSTRTLIPAKEESINFDETENIFIEGENLEVLKVLQKSYFGKVKRIYIDPP